MDSQRDMEATLYAMVHHSVGNLAETQMNFSSFGPPAHIRANFQQGNNMFQANQYRPRNMGESRYWRQSATINSSFEFNNRPVHNQRPVMGFNQGMMSGRNIPSGNRPRIFNSYTPYLNYANYNNGQNNDRHFPNQQQHNRFRGQNNRNKNNRNYNRNDNRNNNINISKEQRVGKYVAKKQRVEAIKQKVDENKSNLIVLPNVKSYAAKIKPKETVVLTSSDDDEEVMEVPVPSPPMVCIDDSDNEDSNLFATPNVPSCSGLQRKIVDRPCSPAGSVVSDDFIIQNDRSRVNTENINIVEDDELQCRQPTVGSLLTNSNQDLIEESSKNDKSQVVPTNEDNFVAPRKVTNYQVVNMSIRHTDVYESAESSDIPESVYDRPVKHKTKTEATDFIETNSVALSNNATRVKRLSKRKSSGSNKDSEYASSNEEQDDVSIVNRDKTCTPYIVRGTAVESSIKEGKSGTPRTRNKQKRQKFNSINQSDDDFISTLSNICCSENEKDDTPPKLTAKDLVETIDLAEQNKTKKKVAETGDTPMEEDTNEQNKEDCQSLSDIVEVLDVESDNNPVVIVDEGNLDISNNSKKRKKISLVDECNDAEIGWNTEMRNFYNESWGGENFDLTEVQSKMKGSPSLWRIRNDDKFPVIKYGRATKLRCLNCCEIGHIQNKCPQPRKKPVCRMCGSREHKEPRCINKICLKCGAPNIVFSAACNQCRFQNNSRCTLCKQKGHISQYCPDSWRRYHSTTSDHTPLQSKVEYSTVKFCPICGEKGHLAEACNSAVRFLDVPPPTSRIITHTPAYPINKDAPKNSSPQNKLLKASLTQTQPKGSAVIKLQKYVSFDKKTYFGRFLDAIGHQANEQKKIRSMKRKNNMLLNPFSKFPKPVSSTNESNIERFSFSEEMEKLNKSNDTNQSFRLDFSTTNKPREIFPSTSASVGVAEKKSVVVAEEKSDSNYSFSEFYDKGGAPQNIEPPIVFKDNVIVEEIPKKVGRNDHMVERDYISLTLNDEEVNVAKQSQPDELHIVLNEPEESSNSAQRCTAKIFLSKQDSQLLLARSGQDIISTLCNKYNVVVKMEWQSRGNVLNITGSPSEQDLFHADIVSHIQDSRREQKRKQLEQSLQVPKHKKPLIRFIDNLFSMLKINLGDVNQVYRKMTYNETLKSRNGQKMADRSRRVLNMILFGQTGLREGKQHLDALKNISTQLKCEDEDIPITNEFRNELFRHVKYIFSPFEHPNYNGAIKDYYDIKYSSEELENDEPRLKPNPLAIVNQFEDQPIYMPKQANIELPENFIASDEWSLKCKELVDQCRTLLENDECSAKVISKLDRVYEKALKRELNRLDYQALQKIMIKIQSQSKLGA